MKNDQERDANTNARHDSAPKPPPMVPRLRLIVIGHGATLLPLCPGAKSKWHRAAVVGVGDPRLGWLVASSSRRRNQRDDLALVSAVNAKVLRVHSDDTMFGVD